MKKLFIILFILCSCTIYAQTFELPDYLSSYDIAEWAGRSGHIASGSGIPTAVASEGFRYTDIATPTIPTEWRYTDGAWRQTGGGGGSSDHSLLSNLDYDDSNHVGFNSSASFTEHVETQTNPHGASMTVEQGITVGTGSTDASITRPSSGLALISSYVALPFETARPTTQITSDTLTIYANGTEKILEFHDGSKWHAVTRTFGEIHVHDATASQAIPTGTTYTKITLFAEDGVCNDVTCDAANDKITITRAGVYQITGHFSFSSDTGNTIYYGVPFLDGIEQNSIHFQRKVSIGGDVGAAGLSGLIEIATVPADVDFRVRTDDPGTVNMTITYGNLNVYRVGDI